MTTKQFSPEHQQRVRAWWEQVKQDPRFAEQRESRDPDKQREMALVARKVIEEGFEPGRGKDREAKRKVLEDAGVIRQKKTSKELGISRDADIIGGAGAGLQETGAGTIIRAGVNAARRASGRSALGPIEDDTIAIEGGFLPVLAETTARTGAMFLGDILTYGKLLQAASKIPGVAKAGLGLAEILKGTKAVEPIGYLGRNLTPVQKAIKAEESAYKTLQMAAGSPGGMVAGAGVSAAGLGDAALSGYALSPGDVITNMLLGTALGAADSAYGKLPWGPGEIRVPAYRRNIPVDVTLVGTKLSGKAPSEGYVISPETGRPVRVVTQAHSPRHPELEGISWAADTPAIRPIWPPEERARRQTARSIDPVQEILPGPLDRVSRVDVARAEINEAKKKREELVARLGQAVAKSEPAVAAAAQGLADAKGKPAYSQVKQAYDQVKQAHDQIVQYRDTVLKRLDEQIAQREEMIAQYGAAAAERALKIAAEPVGRSTQAGVEKQLANRDLWVDEDSVDAMLASLYQQKDAATDKKKKQEILDTIEDINAARAVRARQAAAQSEALRTPVTDPAKRLAQAKAEIEPKLQELESLREQYGSMEPGPERDAVAERLREIVKDLENDPYAKQASTLDHLVGEIARQDAERKREYRESRMGSGVVPDDLPELVTKANDLRTKIGKLVAIHQQQRQQQIELRIDPDPLDRAFAKRIEDINDDLAAIEQTIQLRRAGYDPRYGPIVEPASSRPVGQATTGAGPAATVERVVSQAAEQPQLDPSPRQVMVVGKGGTTRAATVTGVSDQPNKLLVRFDDNGQEGHVWGSFALGEADAKAKKKPRKDIGRYVQEIERPPDEPPPPAQSQPPQPPTPPGGAGGTPPSSGTSSGGKGGKKGSGKPTGGTKAEQTTQPVAQPVPQPAAPPAPTKPAAVPGLENLIAVQTAVQAELTQRQRALSNARILAKDKNDDDPKVAKVAALEAEVNRIHAAYSEIDAIKKKATVEYSAEYATQLAVAAATRLEGDLAALREAEAAAAKPLEAEPVVVSETAETGKAPVEDRVEQREELLAEDETADLREEYSTAVNNLYNNAYDEGGLNDILEEWSAYRLAGKEDRAYAEEEADVSGALEYVAWQKERLSEVLSNYWIDNPPQAGQRVERLRVPRKNEDDLSWEELGPVLEINSDGSMVVEGGKDKIVVQPDDVRPVEPDFWTPYDNVEPTREKVPAEQSATATTKREAVNLAKAQELANTLIRLGRDPKTTKQLIKLYEGPTPDGYTDAEFAEAKRLYGMSEREKGSAIAEPFSVKLVETTTTANGEQQHWVLRYKGTPKQRLRLEGELPPGVKPGDVIRVVKQVDKDTVLPYTGTDVPRVSGNKPKKTKVIPPAPGRKPVAVLESDSFVDGQAIQSKLKGQKPIIGIYRGRTDSGSILIEYNGITVPVPAETTKAAPSGPAAPVLGPAAPVPGPAAPAAKAAEALQEPPSESQSRAATPRTPEFKKGDKVQHYTRGEIGEVTRVATTKKGQVFYDITWEDGSPSGGLEDKFVVRPNKSGGSGKTTPPGPQKQPSPEWVEGMPDAWNRAVDEATQRSANRQLPGIRDILRDEGGSFDPNTLAQVITDESLILSRRMIRETVKKAQWARELVTKYGDEIKQHVRAIWDQARAYISNPENFAKEFEQLDKIDVDAQPIWVTQLERWGIAQDINAISQRIAEIGTKLGVRRRGPWSWTKTEWDRLVKTSPGRARERAGDPELSPDGVKLLQTELKALHSTLADMQHAQFSAMDKTDDVYYGKRHEIENANDPTSSSSYRNIKREELHSRLERAIYNYNVGISQYQQRLGKYQPGSAEFKEVMLVIRSQTAQRDGFVKLRDELVETAGDELTPGRWFPDAKSARVAIREAGYKRGDVAIDGYRAEGGKYYIPARYLETRASEQGNVPTQDTPEADRYRKILDEHKDVILSPDEARIYLRQRGVREQDAKAFIDYHAKNNLRLSKNVLDGLPVSDDWRVPDKAALREHAEKIKKLWTDAHDRDPDSQETKSLRSAMEQAEAKAAEAEAQARGRTAPDEMRMREHAARSEQIYREGDPQVHTSELAAQANTDQSRKLPPVSAIEAFKNFDAWLESNAQHAWDRLLDLDRKYPYRLNSTPVLDYALVMADLLRQGVKSARDVAKRLGEFTGTHVKPYFQEAWKLAKDIQQDADVAVSRWWDVNVKGGDPRLGPGAQAGDDKPVSQSFKKANPTGTPNIKPGKPYTDPIVPPREFEKRGYTKPEADAASAIYDGMWARSGSNIIGAKKATSEDQGRAKAGFISEVMRGDPGEAAETAYRELMDRTVRMKTADEFLVSIDTTVKSPRDLSGAGELAYHESAGKQLRAESRVNGIAHGIIKYGVLDPTNPQKILSESFEAIFDPFNSLKRSITQGIRAKLDGDKAYNQAVNDFENWLIARTIVDRHNRGQKTPYDADMERVKQFAEDGEKIAMFVEAEKRFRKFEDALLDYTKARGLYDEVQIDAMRAANPHHAPLFYLILPEMFERPAGKRDLPFAKSVGSEEGSIIPPLVSVVKNVVTVVKKAQHNLALDTLAQHWDKADPGKRTRIMEEITEESRYQPRKADLDQVAKDLRLGDSAEEAAKLLSPTGDVKFGMDRLSALATAAGERGGVREGQNIIHVYQNGKLRRFQVNDPKLLETIMATRRSYERKGLGAVLEAAASMLRVGATTHPGFALVNWPADSQNYAITNPRTRVFVDSFLALGDILGIDKDFLKTFKLTGPSEDAKTFALAGGSMTTMTTQNRGSLDARTMKLIGRSPWDLRHELTPGEAAGELSAYMLEKIGFRPLSQISEESGRIGVFKRERDYLLSEKFQKERVARGLSRLTEGEATLEAAHRAADALDFTQGGMHTKEWSKKIPFYNIAFVGLDRVGRALREDPDSIKRVATNVLLVSAALWAYNSQDPRWEKVTDDEKRRFWIFMPWWDKKAPPMMLRKPHVLGEIGGTSVEVVLDTIFKENPRVRQRLMHIVTNILNLPIPSGALSTAEVLVGEQGYSVHRGGPIVPGSMVGQGSTRGVEPKDRYTENTSEIAKWLGEVTNTAPLKWDYWTNQQLGGLGSLWIKPAVEKATGKQGLLHPIVPDERRAAPPKSSTPIIGRMYSRATEGVSQVQNNFFETRDRVNDIVGSHKNKQKLISEMPFGEERERERKKLIDNIPRFREAHILASRINAAAEQLAAINRRIRITDKDKTKTPQERRRLINQLHERKDQIAKRAMRPASKAK